MGLSIYICLYMNIVQCNVLSPPALVHYTRANSPMRAHVSVCRYAYFYSIGGLRKQALSIYTRTNRMAASSALTS